MVEYKSLQASKQKQWLFLIAIVVFTFLVYIPLFQNDFLKTWDDDRYILENPKINDFSQSNILHLFTIYYDGHYHPITLISLSFDYLVGGLNPKVYHLTNLVIHLINVFLVFWFVNLLFRRKNPGIALLTSLLFGIGTVHVESVAWASERKNVLFVMFFLASLIAYLNYLELKKVHFYIVSLVLFLISVLSKSMAISLAVTLPAVDYFYGRKLADRKIILEKIPFFLIAVIFGVVAVFAQKSSWGQDLSQEHFSLAQRILFGSYAFILYIVKLLFPIGLSGFYPYPGEISGAFLFYSILTLLFSIGFLILLYKLIKNKQKELAFPLLFFGINIFLLLKIFEVPAGDYLMADRYAYLPSIGLFLLLAMGIERILLLRNLSGKTGLAVFIAYVLFISLQTFNRIPVWGDDESFYTDIIHKYPDAEVAYTNRGGLRKNRGNLNGALNDFNQAIMLGKNDYKAYANRGAVYSDMKVYDKALQDYEKAIAANGSDPKLLGNYGYVKLKTGDFSGAIRLFDRVVRTQGATPEIYANRGTAKYNLGNFKDAINDYTTALEMNPGYLNAVFNRGLARLNSNQNELAIGDFKKAVEIEPDHAESYANMGIAWSRLGKVNKAIESYNRAIEINPNYTDAYLNRGLDKYYKQDLIGAKEDFDKVLDLNPNVGPAYYFRGMVLLQSGDKNYCEDFKKADQLGFVPAGEKINKFCE
ncbi:MAG: tetratricopeptide repeat protein [Bacteroidales bacterium]|nr:tetratricopeptide repeat protein [Bacteroidales bacterium]